LGEKIINGILFVLALVYLIYARDMPFGRLASPRFGFVPQIVGWAAAFVSGFLLIQSLLGKGDCRHVRLQTDWKSLLLIVVSIIAYIFVLPYAGYIVSCFLVLLAVLKIGKVRGWITPIIVSVLTPAVFYSIFKIALSVPLPSGIFE
jgi:putative tricarboxylic transport membrane protein